MGPMIAVCALCGLTVFVGAFLAGLDKGTARRRGQRGWALEIAAGAVRSFGACMAAGAVVVFLATMLLA